MRRAVVWFRRDLRVADHPALAGAAEAFDEVVPLFVLDDRLRRPSGPNRLAFLSRCLHDLHGSTDGALAVRTGDPVEVVPAVVAEAGADAVFVTADFGPYGSRRDEAVAAALDVDLHAVGSPYAVDPGLVERAPGQGYAVYSAYERAWRRHHPGPASATKLMTVTAPRFTARDTPSQITHRNAKRASSSAPRIE